MSQALENTQTPDSSAYMISNEPFYLPVGDEKPLFTAAYNARLPVMLKGPTGCGKTRFVQHMAYKLGRPLVTVSCHEDLFASDLLGRYLLKDDETVWVDGPLSRAVRMGAICYLDEVVEARKDTTVVIHPLTDDRRILSLDKKGEVVEAHPDFLLVVSYNPGYQSVVKDLKQSTRQRFVCLEFEYPSQEDEAKIVEKEGGVDEETALSLVGLAHRIRNLREQGLAEGASTRLLIYAAQLIRQGISPKNACLTSMCLPITDDPGLSETIFDLIEDLF
ncbi:CbbQ/NirQ/NorQ/GpvN family protein [Desulfatibacillum aliphaticivorans]|uniref:ATPase associated with various cellular activities AAA_5 n=1 Tax=Desulfatibacillum aliphaticivorans TaxID=218208 RepID=B8FEP1_DESAL|nr:CbbQ/NirQ/NorQ/GpvN family protein [Desulfatibacillum aliphaticivorans]ACL03568.1 ATPase associated with various cellular activities AAA_5 [Desulfatibacillum aliphaticivorans]